MLQRLDLLAYDLLAGDLLSLSNPADRPTAAARSFLTTQAATDAVIVTIDDASLNAVGRWPWPRRQHAALIDKLRESGAQVIAYDLPFNEAAADPLDDELLARAMVRHGRVILPVQPGGRAGKLSVGVQQPVPLLVQAAAATAHDELTIDADGSVRRIFLGARLGAQQWDSMPRAVWRLQQGGRLQAPTGPLSYREQALAQGYTSWTLEDEAMVAAGAPVLPQVSASRVLLDPRVRPLLAGRTVWVGLTATGLSEPVATPAARPALAWSRITWLAQAHEALSHTELVEVGTAGSRIAAGLAPLLLVLLVAPGRHSEWRGRWLLPLGSIPILLAVVGLLLSRQWLPPAAATLGWLLGYGLSRAAHLQATRQDLQRARGHAAATLRAISDGVITVDTQHRVLFMNPVAWRFARTSPQLADRNEAGMPVTQLIRMSDADQRRVADAIDTSLYRRAVVQVSQPVEVHTLVGPRLVRMTASPVIGRQDPQERQANPHPDGSVLVLSDVTDSVRAAERMQHEATHDALTGLPNRVTLANQFARSLDEARAAGGALALLFIDIDRFKRINDSLGHREGDAVIQLMAERLQQACGPDTCTVRWGGDEFVALVADRGALHEASQVAQRVIDSVAVGIDLADMHIHCSCSIGIAVAPTQGEALDTLLTLADAALRRAKLHGGGRFEFCSPASNRLANAPSWTRDVLTLEARLRRALAENALELHYQPQLDVVSTEPVGFEALLRWRQADGILWSPAQFLDVAEESGLILEIGAWVVREATQQLARWSRAGLPVLPVSINVSARQCLDRRLIHLVSEALSAEQIPASLLKLEITETTAMTDIDHVMRLLNELRALGVGVAVDDFGTGYSSLAHLQRLPIDQIKIDQSFVRDIANDHQGAAIVRATIALAHELGVPVVAEGVEDETQLTFLTLHRCDIAQGYYFARPLSGEAAGDYLREAQRAGGMATQPMLALG
jgi:diguanylate cyclase (GGDEF)-like protein